MKWIPIPSSGGNLRRLGIREARELGAPAAAPAVTDTRVSNQQISVSLAANLGLGAIFSGSVSFNETGYWLDAMAYTDQFDQQPGAYGTVLANRYGFGLRVMFRVTILNPKADLNFGAIGASIDAQFASATYEIDAFGLGLGALPIILDGMAQSGVLTGDAFYQLNTTILSNLTAYLSAHIGQFQPQRVAALVQASQPGTSLDVSHAVLYAMREIRSGDTLQTAIQDAGDLDAASIRLVYGSVLGDVSDTTHPTSSQEDKANEWLADD